jgi:hypothetical protein
MRRRLLRLQEHLLGIILLLLLLLQQAALPGILILGQVLPETS